MKKKNQTVIATEENVISFIKSDVYLFIDTLRQLGGDKKFEHEQAMRMLDAKFGNISEELMTKVSKALEEHGIVDTEQEVKQEKKQEKKQEVKQEKKQEAKEKKQAKWVFSKTVKLDAFERMLEKAWADSGLKDESIKQAVRDEIAKWHKLDSASPLAGYSKYHRPQSQEELEMGIYECFAMQFSKYNKDMEDKDMEDKDMEQTVKDEELKEAEWEYFEDETGDSPYAEATATIDGKEVTVGYLWDEQDGGCYVRIDGADVEDKAICDHCCEVAQKAIGKELTGLSYGLWESWVEYHGLHEGWEDMDEDERYELYNKAIVQC